MKLKCLKEPASANYVYVSPSTQSTPSVFHLITPVGRGINITTYNTCELTKPTRIFFGKILNEIKMSALWQLDCYKAALEADIALLPESKCRSQKQERLIQVAHYIDVLRKIGAFQNYTNLIFDNRYPDEIQTLLARKDNLLSINLRPTMPATMMRTVSPIFSVKRSDDGLFYETLMQEYKNFKLEGPRERLIKAVVVRKKKVTLKMLQSNLMQKVKSMFGVDIDFTQNSKFEPITRTKIKAEMRFDHSVTLKRHSSDYIEALLGYCAPELSMEDLLISPFKSLNNINELILATQFFLSEINIYCYAAGLSNKNFGEILELYNGVDSEFFLAKEVTTAVKTAFANNTSAEQALFDFINLHYGLFALKQPLDEEALKTIQEEFKRNFPTVKDSHHGDEVSILVDKPGTFVTHQELIGFDLTELIRTGFPDLMNDFFKEVNAHTLPHCVPHSNEEVVCEIPDEEVAQIVISLTQNTKTLESAATILLSDTDNKLRVFQRLDNTTIETIKNSSDWKILYSILQQRMEGQTLTRQAFETCFEQSCKSSVFFSADASNNAKRVRQEEAADPLTRSYNMGTTHG